MASRDECPQWHLSLLRAADQLLDGLLADSTRWIIDNSKQCIGVACGSQLSDNSPES